MTFFFRNAGCPQGPPRVFRDRFLANPGMTESELLNSNNRTSEVGNNVDVLVCGAGIIGLIYAIDLKKCAPHLNIMVVEKAKSPQYKIGESTLSPFSKFCNSHGLKPEYMLRLFGIKDGLDFFCVDESGDRVVQQDVGALDISYPLDRRVSELLLTMWAQKLGVQVNHGVAAESMKSDPKVMLKQVEVKIGGKETREISAKVVTDASGFSRTLSGSEGGKLSASGWNTDAFWAYFKETGKVTNDQLAAWTWPATKHVCFPEGWMWFIKLISWHESPLPNLMDLLAHFIDLVSSETPEHEMPSTQDLSALFDCPFEFITSIGFAVRDDRKVPDNIAEYGRTEVERTFRYYQQKYPVVGHVMSSYTLLQNYYNNKTYFVRKHMTYASEVVATPGFFAIGNAAMFTNPLISPGINAGLSGALWASKHTQTILGSTDSDVVDSIVVMQRAVKCAAEYDEYFKKFAVPSLNKMNTFFYYCFRDLRLFEAAIILFFAVGLPPRYDFLISEYKVDFDEHDWNWLVGAGNPGFSDVYRKLLPLIEGPCDGSPVSDSVVSEVQCKAREVLKLLVRKHGGVKWGQYLRHYDDQLKRNPLKNNRDPGSPLAECNRCDFCAYWMPSEFSKCILCGSKKGPADANVVAERAVTLVSSSIFASIKAFSLGKKTREVIHC